jgi:hypothetical protein
MGRADVERGPVIQRTPGAIPPAREVRLLFIYNVGKFLVKKFTVTGQRCSTTPALLSTAQSLVENISITSFCANPYVHRDQQAGRAGDRACLVHRHRWLLEAADGRYKIRGRQCALCAFGGPFLRFSESYCFGNGSDPKFAWTKLHLSPFFTKTRVDFARAGSVFPSLSCVTPT